MAKPKRSARLRTPSFSTTYLLIFLAIFAVGGYAIYRTFAASRTPGVLEAETMTRSTGVKVFSDEGASGDKAVVISKNNTKGLTGNLEAPYEAFSFSVIARATSCRGVFPSVTVNISGGGVSKSLKTKVKALGWKTYEVSNLSLPADQTYKVKVGYSTYSKTKKCQTKLYIDAVKLEIQPAQITATAADKVKEKKAKLTATFDTHGQPATYYFEYGPTTAYGTVTEVKDAEAVDGPQDIKQKINKLTPGTTYHFRFCAINTAATICGPDTTFVTPAKD